MPNNYYLRPFIKKYITRNVYNNYIGEYQQRLCVVEQKNLVFFSLISNLILNCSLELKRYNTK